VGANVSEKHAASIVRVEISGPRKLAGYIGRFQGVTQMHEQWEIEPYPGISVYL
jgi:hypothetical protein